jgi:hypothetical protein
MFEGLKKFYVTFGSAHVLGFGAYYYVIAFAPDEISVRLKMNELSNGRWAGIYTEPVAHGEHLLGYLVIEENGTWFQRGPDWNPSKKPFTPEGF